MDTLMQLVTKGNDFLWSFLLLVLLCGTGLYYTIRLRFIQVRKFGEGVRQVFGHFSMNGEKHEKGEMTPFQSIATAIAAQVQETLPERRQPSSAEARARSSGCGSVHSSEWRRSTERQFWHRHIRQR